MVMSTTVVLDATIQVPRQNEGSLETARLSDCGKGKASPTATSRKIVAPHRQTSRCVLITRKLRPPRKPPSARRLKNLGRGAYRFRIAGCHAHATPTRKRPASFGSLNTTTEAPRPSAANAGYRHSNPYSPDQDFPSPGVDAPLNSNPQWSVPPLNFRPHTPPVGQHPAGRAQQPAPMNRPSAAQPPLVPNQGQRAAR